jgi:hypothetical protein
MQASPGGAIGICNACSTAYDLASPRKRALPIEEPILDVAPQDGTRLPFIAFDASGGGAAARVYVMAFAITRIGGPSDDGMRLTASGKSFETRPGGLDQPPDLSLATAAALARFSALKRLDPDGASRLRPEGVALSEPAILAVPFVERGDRRVNALTGLTSS